MSSTKADMRNLVLRYLTKLTESQTVSAYDADVVESAIDRCQAFLEADGLAYWETSAIPDGVANAYRAYVAAEVAPEMLSPKEAAPYVMAKESALRDMRRFTAKSDAPVSAVYY